MSAEGNVQAAPRTVLVYRNDLLPISETFIKEQATALSKSKWRAVLVGKRLLKDQLPLSELKSKLLDPGQSRLGRITWKAFKANGHLPSQAVAALRAENPRLVHAHFGPDSLDAWPVANSLGVPLLITLHGYDVQISRDWWESGRAGFRMRFYPRRLLALARRPSVSFLAVSHAIRQRAVEIGIPADKIRLNYIGIDVEKFRPGSTPIVERPKNILFVGRLVEKKGCQYLLEAMSEVQKLHPTARLIVVGDGPLRKTLEASARQHGINAVFRGALGQREILSELHAARVFCLPSVVAENGDAEGFGLVLLEAQACGVPVVTSALGGALEGIRDGCTGYRFLEKDIKMLADRLSKVLDEDEVTAKMALEARRFVVDNFDLRRCAQKLEEIYDRVQ